MILYINKNGVALRVAMAVDAMPPGPIRLPDAATPMGLFINNMADTKTAAQRRPSSYRINILAMQR